MAEGSPDFHSSLAHGYNPRGPFYAFGWTSGSGMGGLGKLFAPVQ